MKTMAALIGTGFSSNVCLINKCMLTLKKKKKKKPRPEERLFETMNKQ